MIHKLKTWINFYKDIELGMKRFEIRKNDRDFKIDDILVLQEYNNITNQYTGKEKTVKVDYMLEGGQFGLEEGYVILGFTVYRNDLHKFCNEYWDGQLAEGWLTGRFNVWAGIESEEVGDKFLEVTGDYYDGSLEIHLYNYNSLDDFHLSDEGIKEIIETKLHFWVNLHDKNEKAIQDQYYYVKDNKLCKGDIRNK